MRHVVFASSFVSLVAVGLLAGCPDRSISEVTPQQGRVEAKDIPVNVNRDVDILFVIDDSPSMADKQTNLAANFPKFIEVLSTIQGGLPNVHIAVVTSDMGSKGADGVVAPGIGTIGNGGCSGRGKGGDMQLFGAPVMGSQYISDIRQEPSGTRQGNYMGMLSDAFAKMAKAGAGGCGFEQHLEAMKQALQPNNPVNKGFLRNIDPNVPGSTEAFLAVVFIADEDDCSMAKTTMLGSENATLGPQQSFRCSRFGIICDDGGSTTNAMNQTGVKTKCHPNDASPYLTKVADYVEFLKGLKKDPKKVIVAGIMGKTDLFEVELRAPPKTDKKVPALKHSCTYTGANGVEVADPPIRLKFFLDQFPNRSTFSQICQQDLSGGLQQIGDLLKAVIGDPCIEGKLADVDPNAEGKQYDCSVSSVTDPGTALQKETIMPRCTPEDGTATNQPCWHLLNDPAGCPCSAALNPDGGCPTNSEHYTLKVEGKDTLAKDTHVIANCVTEVTNN
jgi:hypothetical protein